MTEEKMNDLVALSLQYEGALECWPLICVNGKTPVHKGWPTGPAAEPKRWRDRLARWHGNVGIVCGSLRNGLYLVGVDADLYHEGARGALDALYDLGLPKETTTALTGGGGYHLLYLSPVPIQSRPLDGFPGIDVKCVGGFLVAPYSTHPETDRLYEWEFSYAPWDVGPVLLPDRIIRLLDGGEHHREIARRRRRATYGPSSS